MHHVPPTPSETSCRCGDPATHRVAEVVAWDDPHLLTRRPLLAFVCCRCFYRLFGPAADCLAAAPGHYQI